MLPSATSALAGGYLPSLPAISLLRDMAKTLIRTGLALPTPLPTPHGTVAATKSALVGGLKCVYFLDLFFNKKENERNVTLWGSVGTLWPALFRSPKAILRSLCVPLCPGPGRALTCLTKPLAGAQALGWLPGSRESTPASQPGACLSRGDTRGKRTVSLCAIAPPPRCRAWVWSEPCGFRPLCSLHSVFLGSHSSGFGLCKMGIRTPASQGYL